MTKVSHRPVSESQRGRARALRRNMTDAERKLWAELRGHRFQGLAFRRQSPIGPFIVDFVCQRCRLIVEIDGGQHFEDAGQKHDMRRDTYFEARGYRVLRVSNLDVLTNREGVLETIAAAITARPLPSPPPQAGEGAKR